jgi:hypothetical protein
MRPFEDRTKPYFSFVFTGPEVDHARIASDRQYLLSTFYEVSGRHDVQFGDILWVSDYRPNIRMVDKFGEGRVFIGGGELESLIRVFFAWANPNIDACHIHSPTGGQASSNVLLQLSDANTSFCRV